MTDPQLITAGEVALRTEIATLRAQLSEALDKIDGLESDLSHCRERNGEIAAERDVMRGVVGAARIFKIKHPTARIAMSPARAKLDAAINRLDALTSGSTWTTADGVEVMVVPVDILKWA